MQPKMESKFLDSTLGEQEDIRQDSHLLTNVNNNLNVLKLMTFVGVHS